MYTFPKTPRGLRSRIARYKTALQRERRIYQCYDDGAGKRYLLFWLYFLLDDLREAQTYFRWYLKNFEDDSGEPIQKLCWALALHRMGNEQEAVFRLADLMLTNLYVIPAVLGIQQPRHDMWHSSNFSEPDYAQGIPAEILQAIKPEEKQWIAALNDSFEFRRLRKRYIEIFRQLAIISDPTTRGSLVDEAYTLLNSLKPDVISGAMEA